MAEVKWTKEQQEAIDKKGSNILVAAAAGSGKTAVLVERIIKKIINDKVDIDKILVVTFTSAAASEMRERILDAIYKKLEEYPEDENLQKQINLLNKASICTIDSFCLDVIRNNFFEIDISANARVADSTEVTLLKQEVLDEIFEEKYIENNADFLELIETYTKYNRDEDLQDLILKIYNYIQSDPFPEEWLAQKVEMFNINNVNFSDTPWGKIIVESCRENLEDCILKLENLVPQMHRFPELEKYENAIKDDINNYTSIKNNLTNWDTAQQMIENFRNMDWPRGKKVENPLKDDAKKIRDSVKDQYSSIKELIPYDSENACEDIKYMHGILKKLQDIIIEFSEKFYQKKREKNIIDFNDMEHLALKILLEKDEDGNIKSTEVAKRYAEKFEEIAIDEYQDSNLVQECILTSVSKNNNIFMVGDVKQSIYKFRQARPELFLGKYNTYKNEPVAGENRKIQLFKNFRSRKNVLDITNIVFENIMSAKLGDIDYNENEYLNLGASYEEIEKQDFTTQLNIIDLKEEENIWKSDEEGQEEQSTEKVENVVLEARFVAKTIKELLDSKYQVIDKKRGKRNIECRDIAVLLRSANTVAPIYEKEISELGINVYSDSSDGYLQSVEIDTIMSVLKIIDNPMQDIPLVTVLRSAIGNFSDNELVEISLEGNKESFYEKMLKAKEKSSNEELVNKINKLLQNLEKWYQEEKYKPLDELIWQIYIDTGYMNYVSLMPNGELRASNLKMLFEKAKQYETASFKGLYNFVNFMEKVKNSNNDLGAAKIIGESENVVRIMSIHKSKGLEFPVVILAGTGKKFNFQDLNQKLLLHQDLGIGPQYIDADRHIEFKTLAKKAIAIKSKKEITSEEMRVLYVALTRAKEKLIITGMQKNVNKALTEKQEMIDLYGDISPMLVGKYSTYLDWLELIYQKESAEKLSGIMDLQVIEKQSLLKSAEIDEEDEDIKEAIEAEATKLANNQEEEKIKHILDWKYEHNELENIPTKTSVTKIKELTTNSENEKVFDKNKMVPQFLSKDENGKLSAAQRGTLMHLIVQKMNEKKEYDYQKIKELIHLLKEKGIITELEAKNINIAKLVDYTKSDLWKELKEALEIHKEQPFYIDIPVKEIYDNSVETDETVLVQGIIDLYYISAEGNLILIDYKTDYVEKGKENELKEKYAKQLELYKRALESALNTKVSETKIYSLYLNKFID